MNELTETGLLCVLSEESIMAHRAYLERQKYRYSALTITDPHLSRARLSDIRSFRIPREQRRELFALKSDIFLHEKFFESFCERPKRFENLVSRYRSEEGFLYDQLAVLTKSKSSFCYFYRGKRGDICVNFDTNRLEILPVDVPFLALDLCEHAYFTDYGFDRETYLRTALSHLDFARLSGSASKEKAE